MIAFFYMLESALFGRRAVNRRKELHDRLRFPDHPHQRDSMACPMPTNWDTCGPNDLRGFAPFNQEAFVPDLPTIGTRP